MFLALLQIVKKIDWATKSGYSKSRFVIAYSIVCANISNVQATGTVYFCGSQPAISYTNIQVTRRTVIGRRGYSLFTIFVASVVNATK